MFSHEPDRLKPLMEHIEQPAYFVDASGRVLFGNAVALATGGLQLPAPENISLRIPHVSGELVIARSHEPFPLFALREVALRSPAGIIVCAETPGRPIIFVNDAMAQLSGYVRAELLGQNPKIFQSPNAASASRRLIRDRLDAGETFETEIVNCRKGGTDYVCALLVFPLRLTGGPITHWVGIHRDVSETRRNERLFQESQRLEGLGVMAGGIAHDFNNLLTAITGSALLLESFLPGPSELALLRNITAAGSRAGELCRQLLAYAGRSSVPRQALDLSALVDETAALIHLAISRTASFSHVLAPDLPLVDIDPTQFRQIIINLVINASDALEGNPGVITLYTGLATIEQPLAGCRLSGTVPAGNWVEFAVTDTGCGMSEEVQRRIFEPFFTTKTTGHGLGMAAVLGIARSHGGHIVCVSEVGKGTTFRIFLPPSSIPQTPAGGAPAAPRRHGGGVALVIDDDDIVRRLITAVLVRDGFETVTASDGDDGLRLFREHCSRMTLVVVDYSMPKMDGVEIVATMRKEVTIPTIIVTGFDQNDIQSRLSKSRIGPVGFLKKPFTQDGLRAAITQLHEGKTVG